MQPDEHIKGRGAQFNTENPFHTRHRAVMHHEATDEPPTANGSTTYRFEHPRKVINKIWSPDVHMDYSVNPYQGCEHGCIYCYARNSHQYWGLSAGLDFERQIIVKPDVAKMVEQEILHPNWVVKPISLSGNTDCYQPAEMKFGLTREILKVFARYRHPTGLITKNSLITRDLDVLKDLHCDNLVHVAISITTLDEKLRQAMEPRTATIKRRLATVEKLAAAGIPVRVMVAPVIPGLTDHEIPEIVKRAAQHGAAAFSYIIVRLNGSIARLFSDWAGRYFPGKKEKVLNNIASCHAGKLNDSHWFRRMKGEGHVAAAIDQLFKLSVKKYAPVNELPPVNCKAFRRTFGRQGELFG